MQIKCLDAKQFGVELDQLITNASEFYWAVAWATDTVHAELLYKHRKKIRQLVVGTDFAHSSPAFFRMFMEVKNVHVMIDPTSATFHPKMYCFINGDRATAIVGSANFTNGGTNRNTELSLLLEGTVHDEPIQEILSNISVWWRQSKEIDEEFIAAYELQHLANSRHGKKIKKSPRIFRPTSKSSHPGLLATSWDEYLHELKESANGSMNKRLAVLLGARQLLDSVERFSDLDDLERKALAGIIGRREVMGTPLEDRNWGWFGSMKGAGVFKNRIGENDPYLSAAMDHIPLTGEVNEDDYKRFALEYLRAFANSARRGSIVTASRLLAMKRPDYFVCVDSKNARRLSADFGFALPALSLDSYWELVVEPVMVAKWWNVKRPSGTNGKIWDSRAAMLDAIYYEGDLE